MITQMARRAFAILLSLCIAFCSCTEQTPERPARLRAAKPQRQEPQYVPPPAGTKSLIESITARRDSKGAVVVEGKALLPRNTKIVIDVFRGTKLAGKNLVGETKTIVGFDGAFNAGPFDIPQQGLHTVQVTSYFNEIWQPANILTIVGREGANLPRSALRLNDPEFPQEGGSLDYRKQVQLGPLPPDAGAIYAVKRSKLFVKGKGKAVDTVGEIVEFFNKPHTEFKPGEWSATQLPDGKWRVSLQHQWGREKKTANWEYEPKSGRVNYLDPEAKMLSWIPAE